VHLDGGGKIQQIERSLSRKSWGGNGGVHPVEVGGADSRGPMGSPWEV
jgi:hypothetical protein